MSEFAVFRADDWTTMCDREAARWLNAGYDPDDLDPSTGVPLEGVLDRPDPDLDPSVAESALRASDEVLEQIERRNRRVGVAVTATVVVVLAALAWLLGSGVLL